MAGTCAQSLPVHVRCVRFRVSGRWSSSLPWVAAVCLALSACGGHDPVRGVRIIGRKGNQPGQFSKPRAVAVTQEGKLIVIDRSGRFQSFELESGKYLGKTVLPEYSNGTPTGMSLDRRDGSLWIADTHYQRILRYDSAGNLLQKFGEVGIGPGQMIFPTDVCPDPVEDVLWVTEYGEKNRLIKFSRDGRFLEEWTGPAWQETELLRPMAVEVDHRGRLLVADAGHHRINVYDKAGNLLTHIGRPGTGPGELKYPYDVAVAPDGSIYVCEYGNSRISHFSDDGKYLGTWGRPGGSAGELYAPWGVCVGPRGDVVVADTNNNRLQHIEVPGTVFAPIAPPGV